MRQAAAIPALAAAGLGLAAAILLPFVSVAPNRILPGRPLFLPSSFPLPALLLGLLWILHGTLAFLPRASLAARLGRRLPFLLPFLLLLLPALASRGLGPEAPSARIGLAAGFWLGCLAAWAAATIGRPREGKATARRLLGGALLLEVLILYLSGSFDSLALVKEWRAQPEVFLREGLRHLELAGSALLFGSLLGLPIGLLAPRDGRGRGPGFAFLNVAQTIPSLALFGFLIIPLALLASRFPALRAAGIGGIGPAPALIALSIYAALPIARNVNAGLSAVSEAVLDAARGMGMGRFETFLEVELPLALPVAAAGFRTAAVQAVGNAALAALIGAGGLGVFIFQGLGQYAMDLVLAGTLPLVALALIVDGAFAFLSRALTPRGLLLARAEARAA